MKNEECTLHTNLLLEHQEVAGIFAHPTTSADLPLQQLEDINREKFDLNQQDPYLILPVSLVILF
jgi:hypothetical protein